MFKNTASQKWIVFAFEDEGGTNPGEPVTGDAANITANVRIDGGAANAVDDTNPTELEDGYYVFDITAAESNGDLILIAPASATANVNVIGVPGAVWTTTDVSGVEAKIDTIDTNVDAVLVDTGTTLDTKLDDIQGATFNTATDSLEALRNRGDSAWTGSAVTSDSGTAQAGAAGSITLQAGASAIDSTYNGQVIFITGGTGVGQSRAIDAYTGSSRVATIISNWATTPDATSTYDIYPDEITELTTAPTAAAIADAVWDESTAGHTTGGTFGEQVKNDIDAILTDTGTTLDAALAVVDANVDAILVDTGTTIPGVLGTPAGADMSADIAALDAVADAVLVDTGTTLPATLTTIEGKIDTADTVVDAIKVKTDQLTFTKANEVDANTQSINDATVVGDGNTTPWDGA